MMLFSKIAVAASIGIGSLVTYGVMKAVDIATKSVEDIKAADVIKEESLKTVNHAIEMVENGETEAEYTEEDANNDKFIIRVQHTLKIIGSVLKPISWVVTTVVLPLIALTKILDKYSITMLSECDGEKYKFV